MCDNPNKKVIIGISQRFWFRVLLGNLSVISNVDSFLTMILNPQCENNINIVH